MLTLDQMLAIDKIVHDGLGVRRGQSIEARARVITQRRSKRFASAFNDRRTQAAKVILSHAGTPWERMQSAASILKGDLN